MDTAESTTVEKETKIPTQYVLFEGEDKIYSFDVEDTLPSLDNSTYIKISFDPLSGFIQTDDFFVSEGEGSKALFEKILQLSSGMKEEDIRELCNSKLERFKNFPIYPNLEKERYEFVEALTIVKRSLDSGLLDYNNVEATLLSGYIRPMLAILSENSIPLSSRDN